LKEKAYSRGENEVLIKFVVKVWPRTLWVALVAIFDLCTYWRINES